MTNEQFQKAYPHLRRVNPIIEARERVQSTFTSVGCEMTRAQIMEKAGITGETLTKTLRNMELHGELVLTTDGLYALSIEASTRTMLTGPHFPRS